MKNEKILNALDKVDEKFITVSSPENTKKIKNETNNFDFRSKRLSKRKVWLVAVLAAAFVFVGAGVAAVIYGDSIQSWFGYYFGVITGQEMSEEQKGIVDYLSQNINQSQTIGDITVTVDSVTVGDDNFYLLLRVDGTKFSDRHHYIFDTVVLEVSPDPVEGDGGLGSYGIQFHGIDGDGAALMLMDYSYATGEEFTVDTTPLEVHLVLTNLMQGPRTNRSKMIAEGVWEFNFIIDRSQVPEAISLPDTEVLVMDLDTRKEVPITLTNIELTNTGIRFQYDFKGGMLSFGNHLEVRLDNGVTIGESDGSGTPMADGVTLNCAYHWTIPINLDEVAVVRIGNVEIPVE